MFPLFFRFQHVGRSVLLSQIGTGLLGERYAPQVGWGVALIAIGIGLTAWARRAS